MVANQQVDRPGTYDAVVNKLAGFQKQINELTRQTQVPTLQIPMYPDHPEDPKVTAGTFIAQWHGRFPILQPQLSFSATVTAVGASSTGAKIRWRIDTPSASGVYTADEEQIGPGVLTSIQLYDVANADYGSTGSLTIELAMSGTVTAGNYAFVVPIQVWGIR